MSDLSRRALLRAIPSVATVTVVPVAVASAPLADAALVAFAARVVILAKESDEAEADLVRRDDLATAQEPPRPSALANKYHPEWETAASIRHKLAGMGKNSIVGSDLRRRLPALEAWEAECEAINERLGVPAALARNNRINAELIPAVAALAGMKPGTLAGIAAKAEAAQADASWHDTNELNALTAAILADVRRLAGGAHV